MIDSTDVERVSIAKTELCVYLHLFLHVLCCKLNGGVFHPTTQSKQTAHRALSLLADCMWSGVAAWSCLGYALPLLAYDAVVLCGPRTFVPRHKMISHEDLKDASVGPACRWCRSPVCHSS